LQVLRALAMVRKSCSGIAPVRSTTWRVYEVKSNGERLLVAPDGAVYADESHSDDLVWPRLWGSARLLPHCGAHRVEDLREHATRSLLAHGGALVTAEGALHDALHNAFVDTATGGAVRDRSDQGSSDTLRLRCCDVEDWVSSALGRISLAVGEAASSDRITPSRGDVALLTALLFSRENNAGGLEDRRNGSSISWEELRGALDRGAALHQGDQWQDIVCEGALRIVLQCKLAGKTVCSLHHHAIQSVAMLS
jgi:hypothetical protein